MESNIEIRLKESLSLAEKKFKEDNVIEQYEKAMKEFKELVKKGLARERGHNLLSISDKKALSKTAFNKRGKPRLGKNGGYNSGLVNQNGQV